MFYLIDNIRYTMLPIVFFVHNVIAKLFLFVCCSCTLNIQSFWFVTIYCWVLNTQCCIIIEIRGALGVMVYYYWSKMVFDVLLP
jgi:hypothetical protein